MKKFFGRALLVLSVTTLFTFWSCSNSDDDIPAIKPQSTFGDYVFPDASAIDKTFDSYLYDDEGKRFIWDEEDMVLKTTYLVGWESIPFLDIDSLSHLLATLNNRGFNWKKIEDAEGLYSYSYYLKEAGTVYPEAWKDDVLYFDAINQKIYSDAFVRILCPKGNINNGVGGDGVGLVYKDSAESPVIAESSSTEQVKAGGRTTISLADYGLKMFDFGENLYVPFQVVAAMFSSCQVLAFNGKDYFLGTEFANVNSGGNKEYAKYNGQPRTVLLAEYNYRNLCMLFDLNYCLKDQRIQMGKQNISFLHTDIGAGLTTKLRSLSMDAYDDGFMELLFYFIDDGGHTWCGAPSLWGRSSAPASYSDDMEAKYVTDKKTRTNKTEDKREEMMKSRKAKGGGQGISYVGNMAVITFDGFKSGDPTNVLNSWTGTPDNWNDLASTNTYAFLKKAFDDIASHGDTKNVVVDLSANGGGLLNQCLLALCFMENPDKIYFSVRHLWDGSLTKYFYEIGEPLKKDNLRFYVLTSGGSFSCANYFPSICKYQLNIPIVGQQSGGGGGTVKYCSTADGALFQTSAPTEMCAIDASGNYKCLDAGIPVDVAVPEEDFYAGDVLYGNLYAKLKEAYPANFQ